MSKASLYGYFHAKEDMLAAISRETIEGFTRELALILRSALGPEEKLRRVVRQHVRFVIANRSFLTVFFSEEPNLPPRIARALAAQKDRYDKGVEAIVADGVRRGDLSRRAAAPGGVRHARDAQLALQVVQPRRPLGRRGGVGGLPGSPRGRHPPRPRPRAGPLPEAEALRKELGEVTRALDD